MTEPEHARLVAHDWSRGIEGYSPERVFARVRRARGRQTWRLRPHPGGSCRFLGADNLCQVHSALGFAAKPFAGRLYPFTFVITPVGAFIGVRFACPAVVRGEGPPLAA